MGRMAKGSRPQRVRRSFTDEFKAGAVRQVLDDPRRYLRRFLRFRSELSLAMPRVLATNVSTRFLPARG
jgi:hypothetical protein